MVVPVKPGLGITDTGAGYLDYPLGASRQCGLIYSARFYSARLAGAAARFRRRWQTFPATGEREADMEASPAAKLCGFLILLVVVFIAAYAAGAHQGPVVTRSHPGHGQPVNMNMNMGHP